MPAPHSDSSRSASSRGGGPRKPASQATRGGASSTSGRAPRRGDGSQDPRQAASGQGRPTASGQGRPTSATARSGGAPSSAPRAGERQTTRSSYPPPAESRTTSGPRTPAGPRSSTGRPARDGGATPERSRRPRAPQLEVPAAADPALLDPAVRRELRSLAQPDVIAGHLVAAGLLLEEDPSRAYAHAMVAKAMAGRSGAVREAVGVTAYAAGDYAVALAELRAARRITGSAEHLPLLADCERGLGRPDRALAVAAEPEAKRLDRAGKVELAIVVSGARRDLGQFDAAVLALQGAELDSDEVNDWTPRLWYAYADALLAAGRVADARKWFGATVTVDDDDMTDAVVRLESLPNP